jgi:hypothetical protein
MSFYYLSDCSLVIYIVTCIMPKCLSAHMCERKVKIPKQFKYNLLHYTHISITSTIYLFLFSKYNKKVLTTYQISYNNEK